MSANVTASGVLTANTVSTLNVQLLGGVEVINRTGDAEIWFAIGAPGQVVAPTVGGNGCYMVPAGVTSYVVPWPEPTSNPDMEVEIDLISTGTPSFTVVAVPWSADR